MCKRPIFRSLRLPHVFCPSGEIRSKTDALIVVGALTIGRAFSHYHADLDTGQRRL